jgi:hypothetical protein
MQHPKKRLQRPKKLLRTRAQPTQRAKKPVQHREKLKRDDETKSKMPRKHSFPKTGNLVDKCVPKLEFWNESKARSRRWCEFHSCKTADNLSSRNS